MMVCYGYLCMSCCIVNRCTYIEIPAITSFCSGGWFGFFPWKILSVFCREVGGEREFLRIHPQHLPLRPPPCKMKKNHHPFTPLPIEHHKTLHPCTSPGVCPSPHADTTYTPHHTTYTYMISLGFQWRYNCYPCLTIVWLIRTFCNFSIFLSEETLKSLRW